jgi:hypothetical protein
MKKLLIMTFALLLVLTGCATTEPENTAEPVVEYKEDIFKTYDDYHNQMIVDIGVGEEGFYSTYADVVLHYYRGELSYIYVKDPVLLAFRHSEKWEGGYHVYSHAEIEAIIERLQEYPELEDIVHDLEYGLFMDNAST